MRGKGTLLVSSALEAVDLIENTNIHRQQGVAYILKQDVVIKLNNAVTRFIYKEKTTRVN